MTESESSAEAAIAVDQMSDDEFDGLLPSTVRKASRIFWSPVVVARCAAQLLADLGVRFVLDLGSGPGKFCIVASARAPSISFVGVDHRPRLVAVSRALAAEVGVRNATFDVGDATRMAWAGFDALYVYNSFAENSFSREDAFDETVELSPARRVSEVLRVERALAAMPAGTVLVTYYGLGGPIPGSYDRLHVERASTGWLQVWRQSHSTTRDDFWLEEGADAEPVDAAQVGRYLSEKLEQEDDEA